uniref:Uncharacterized protein n=1 Tax=Anguilla anguilla TaxID=7936 RepID=A0A0E9XMV8_ANGAN
MFRNHFDLFSLRFQIRSKMAEVFTLNT